METLVVSVPAEVIWRRRAPRGRRAPAPPRRGSGRPCRPRLSTWLMRNGRIALLSAATAKCSGSKLTAPMTA